MANKCANCGSRNIQHEVDSIFCPVCGKHSYEDGSGVVKHRNDASGVGTELSTPSDDGELRTPAFQPFDPEPEKAKAKGK